MAYGRANLELSCPLLHVVVACALVELHQAFPRRKPQRCARRVVPGYSVWCGSSKIWTHLLHVRVWVLLKVELCMVSSQRKRCILARHLSVVHTLQVWLHISLNISSACIVLVSKMQANSATDFSGASYGVFVSSRWQASLPSLRP